MKTEIAIIDPKEFGLEETKGKTIENAFAPKLIERDAFADQYESIIKMELNSEAFKLARELRLKLVKVRTGIADIHETEKAFFLASGKYVDAIKNKLTLPIKQMEEKLKDIEDYEARLEAERKANLKAERIKAFEPYGTDVSFMPLDEMTEEQFKGQLDIAKTSYDAKIAAERKAEQERISAEQKAEEERKERERLEAERIEAQRLENERLKKEAEKREKEIAIERKKQAEEQDKKDAEAKKEKDRLAKIAAEEKAKADKLAADLKAKQDAEKAAIEGEEKRKRDLANAGDQAIFRDFYNTFKGVEFPELQNKEISDAINLKLSEVCKFMIEQSKKLI